MPHSLVIFGASGDLTSRKLIPGLYSLFRKGRLPAETRIIGFARSDFSDAQWRETLTETTAKFAGADFEQASWDRFAECVFYHSGDIGQPESFDRLMFKLAGLEGDIPAMRVFYLATAPERFAPAITQLGRCCRQAGPLGCRVVVEKPFGTDLPTARALNSTLHEYFAESQIYRIDHYLGKETVQNLQVLRFGNTIFEPVWNRNYIDHVQITAAEEVDVGRRGDYYDKAGVLRDMFQNHLLQLMTATAMEPPARFDADSVRNEKVKVLAAVRPIEAAQIGQETIRGQYLGYLESKGVPPESQTASYAAIKLHIDNWRWQGVPFYLRSGKAMSCRTTQIVIQFRQPPHFIFHNSHQAPPEANRLVIHIQPAEGLQLHFQTKQPDAGMKMQLTSLDFRYDKRFTQRLPEAYERLLLDVLAGDASLFARSDEVELAWDIIDPLVAGFAGPHAPPLWKYDRGLWGPLEASQWMERDGRQWLDACPVL